MDLDLLNSLTKYPSIPTWHVLGDKGSMPGETCGLDMGVGIIVTEKIDGTNARIIVLDDGDWFIGSREHLLHAKGDRIWDVANGIVAALQPYAARCHSTPLVIYGEVYGGKIKLAREYTSTGSVGFRVFDVVDLAAGIRATHGMTRAQIAEWRESVQPSWCSWETAAGVAESIGASMVPRIGALSELPSDVAAASEWLNAHVLGPTRAGMDFHGAAEGVVVRDANNLRRVKLRVEDYRRALRKKGGA